MDLPVLVSARVCQQCALGIIGRTAAPEFVPAGAPDRLIRQTSETAANWHQWADRISRKSGQVAPPPYSQRGRAGGMVITAKRIRFVAPTYPQKALEEGLSGSVTVDFIVDANGEPTEARIADANPSMVCPRHYPIVLSFGSIHKALERAWCCAPAGCRGFSRRSSRSSIEARGMGAVKDQ